MSEREIRQYVLRRTPRAFSSMDMMISIYADTNEIAFVPDPAMAARHPDDERYRYELCVKLAAPVRYQWPPERGMEP